MRSKILNYAACKALEIIEISLRQRTPDAVEGRLFNSTAITVGQSLKSIDDHLLNVCGGRLGGDAGRNKEKNKQ